MKITLNQLEAWLSLPKETETIEFKEAKNTYSEEKLLEYCVAIANEKGGYLILGVSDQNPRQIVGTKAFNDLNKIKSRVLDALRIRVNIHEVYSLEQKRVLVFEIPSRPTATPLSIKGTYFMRSGEQLVGMTPDQLKRIFAEDKQEWGMAVVKDNLTGADIISLLDTQSYFDLMGVPYPESQKSVLSRLLKEELITQRPSGWGITQMAAILLAKKLEDISSELARKATRFVIYDGKNKTKTKVERLGVKGYAVGFEVLVDLVHSSAPQNHFVEVAIREEVKMFPRQALRELIANALVHQDFSETGHVFIEMYDDRVEISNPGTPPINVQRFIDEFKSRNERLADIMRRMGICEEKGSGVDKVIHLAEQFQLPAPDFRANDIRTTAVLFSHQEFSKMSKDDRIRACYQHCCLMYLSNQKMSNNSLRERFLIPAERVATVSNVIAATKEQQLIRIDDSETTSTRYARYLPFWA